jgi:hypothetical protein
MTEPTYTAAEIKKMCLAADFDHNSYKILVELIEKEIELYSAEDLAILAQSAIIVLNKGILKQYMRLK